MPYRRLILTTVAVSATVAVLVPATVWLRRNGDPASAGARPFKQRFTLVSHRGETVTDVELSGRPLVLFFGFTHCPDVCPTALAEISRLLVELGPAADRLSVFFVSVDPERDSSGVLANYLSAFDDRITGLTGSVGDVARLISGLGVSFQKIENAEGGYAMEHPAGTYLLRANGTLLGTLDPHEPEAARQAKLRRLAASG